MTKQPTVETEQGKQVLVAKCAFSEQRNDSYVLASVVTGTLPRVELTGKPTAAAATPAFMNGVPFPLMGRTDCSSVNGLGSKQEQNKNMKLLYSVCIHLYFPNPTELLVLFQQFHFIISFRYQSVHCNLNL